MHHIIDRLISAVGAGRVVTALAIGSGLEFFKTSAIASELCTALRDEPTGGRNGWNSC